MLKNKFRLTAFSLLTMTLLLFVYIAFMATDHALKSKLIIVVAPSSATLKIDGAPANNDVNYVSAGKHSIEASLNGFETVTKDATIDARQSQTVKIILDANSDAGRQYLADNPRYQQEKEALGSQAFSEISDKLGKKYPYISLLPISGRKFSVTQGSAVRTKDTPEDPAIALYVSATDAAERRSSLDYISLELGISPGDVEIVFKNYTNPFLGDVSE